MASSSLSAAEPAAARETELSNAPRLVMPSFMSSFFREVETVKKELGLVRKAEKQTDSLSQQMLLAVEYREEENVSRELAQLMAQTQARIKRVKAKLEHLQAETKQLTDEKQLRAQELRIRTHLQKALQQKFVQAVDRYRAAQQRYSKEVKGKVTRQVQIMKPDADAEYVEQVMQQEGGVQRFYEQVILKTAATEVKDAYDRAVERLDEVKQLEQSVTELAQMFVDMALLVNQQGEMLDSIEAAVINARDLTDAGNEDLEKSIAYQGEIRKKQCCIVAVVVTVLGAIILAVVLSTG